MRVSDAVIGTGFRGFIKPTGFIKKILLQRTPAQRPIRKVA